MNDQAAPSTCCLTSPHHPGEKESRLGLLDRLLPTRPQLGPHLQQLQQGSGVPVPSGVEEQDPHLGPTASGDRKRVKVPPPSPLVRPIPRPSPGLRPHRHTHPWGLWLRCSAWRNQRTQACTLLVVCAPSRYQVRGPRRSTCVRPGHSVSRSPGGGGQGSAGGSSPTPVLHSAQNWSLLAWQAAAAADQS